ncbi:GNAT family N-acetyltransferase [Limnoglobus roseus]|uniref:N-acetyltransferase domain-containing protein n=1 Tax=Limnoglobus roseus TaxID=2598579 RepID=A0A5C1AI96_9BACT|nr:GNAT family N-acetyltransferase [Limnoglobus roseus]QEL18375.1 hypothetical protein PX52LOC_05398 [Limnoglobus roseus]
MAPLKLRTGRLRPVEETDARFVLDLRLDPKLSRHLSPVIDDEEAQRQWIARYQVRERAGREFYFIIESADGGRQYGTVRMYNFCRDTFCWGSWIVLPTAPMSTAIESTLGVYDFGFGPLGFMKSDFDVRKENVKVVRFHQRFGAVVVGQDDENLYFEITKDVYERSRADFARFIG